MAFHARDSLHAGQRDVQRRNPGARHAGNIQWGQFCHAAIDLHIGGDSIFQASLEVQTLSSHSGIKSGSARIFILAVVEIKIFNFLQP